MRRLFLALLGLTYLIAFLSLNAQIPGLIGRHGIVPARQGTISWAAWASRAWCPPRW